MLFYCGMVKKKKPEIQQQELNSKDKKFLTTKDAAAYLGVSVSFIYKLTSQEKIAFYKPSKKLIYFTEKDLDLWVFSNRSQSLTEYFQSSTLNTKNND